MAGAPPVAVTVAPFVAVMVMVAAAEAGAQVHEGGGGLSGDAGHGGLRRRCEGNEQCQREQWHGEHGGLFHVSRCGGGTSDAKPAGKKTSGGIIKPTDARMRIAIHAHVK
jgi:hypothetical protein